MPAYHPDNPPPIWQILKDRRILLKWVADDVGMSYQYVARMLNGKMRPTPAFAKRMAEYLDLPAEELW